MPFSIELSDDFSLGEPKRYGSDSDVMVGLLLGIDVKLGGLDNDGFLLGNYLGKKLHGDLTLGIWAGGD